MSTCGKEDFEAAVCASLEKADISSAVFAVSVTRCNKPGKVNTFQVQRGISVNSYCFFFFSLKAHSKRIIFMAACMLSSSCPQAVKPKFSP